MIIVHSNITKPVYSSVQQKPVRVKSGMVNHMNKRQINISTEPRRRILKTVQSERTDRQQKNTEGHILRTDPPGGPWRSVAWTSNKSTNLKIVSSVRWTNLRNFKIGSLRRCNNQEYISVCTSRLIRKRRIRTHKLLNDQKMYTCTQDA